LAGSAIFSWDLPLPPNRTVGWVIQAPEDEPPNRWLSPGTEHLWEDARSAGKEPGQPVLFLQSGRDPPTWIGWGRILESSERWKVYGVRTVCGERLVPALEVIDPSVNLETISGSEERWENRALGAALGLLHFRNRTPYGEVGARDLRLTDADLHQLVRAQPRLRSLGSHSGPIPVPSKSARDRPRPPSSDATRAAPRTLGVGQAENLVIGDLKRLFGEEVSFSSLKTTPSRFQGQDYWLVEGSFWSDFVVRNFQYAVVADTGELAAKRVDR
jgi:hypothetical protein